MTADEFRDCALAFEGAEESSHMGHPDFRAHGRIFATLFSPDDSWGMVKLPLVEQATLCAAQPAMFRPVHGGWGRMGCTNVHLARVRRRELEMAMRLAWEQSATPQRRSPRKTKIKK